MRKIKLDADKIRTVRKIKGMLKAQNRILFLFLYLLQFLPITGLSQNTVEDFRVTGQVVDANNQPLIGVTIQVVTTTIGTVTDINGNYALNVSSNAILRFSYIGYTTLEINVGSRAILNVVMESSIARLDEIVVIGYGSQRKKDLTGAVSVVDMREAQKLTSGSISELLQGRVAGVTIQSSGDPGSMGRINIRGIGSFSEVGPLFVVDGLIVNDVNHVNPDDIETIQILKDASSTAIYGSRGANGVIIITTKRGKPGETSIEITATSGVQELSRRIPMMNTLEFLHYNELSYLNAGMNWPGNPLAGSYLPDSDFQEAIFQRGIVQNYNITYLQGTENTSFMTGAGFFSQDGVLRGPTYERFTYRVNSEGRFGVLTVGENITFSRAERKLSNFQTSSFTNALIMPPVLPIYDPNEPTNRGGFGYGNLNYPTYTTNPVAQQQSIDNRAIDNRIIGNVYAEIKLFNVLTFRTNLGLDYWYGRSRIKNHAYTMRMGSSETRFENTLNEIRDERMTLIAENTLNYNQTFGKHSIEGLIGLTNQNDRWHYLRNEGYNQRVDGLWQIDLVGVQNNMWGSEQEHRMISYLGRINYNFDNRFLLQMNFRSDGSSRFGPDNRRGYFPSGSFGWRISQENFMEPTRNVIDYLKLRASYGTIGDMQALGNYDYIPGIDHSGPYEGFYAIFGPSGNERVNTGALQSASVNTMLRWERKTTLNIGIDYAFLRDRLFGSADWFNSISTDLLVYLPQSWATGVSNRWTNYGKMNNRGFEFTLGWRDIVGDFRYNVSSNFYTVKNTVLSLGELYREGGWNGVNRTEDGRSVGDFYLIESEGIFQSMDEVFEHTTTLYDGTVELVQPTAQPGDVRYVDYNQDGHIDLDDRQWMGSPLPKFLVGLNFSANYRGVDFTMHWTSSYGNKIFNIQRYELLKFDVDNFPADVSPWTWDNLSNEYPRPYASANENRRAQTDRYLEDGSYIRLKNIQLGYTLPRAWMERFYVDQLRIFLGVQNLFTITRYKGYDPEILNFDVFGQGNDWGGFPPVRLFNMGLQASF